MDAAELESFHRDGFLAVPGVLSADTVARMNGIIDEAAQQRQSDAEGTTSRDDHSVGPFYHYFDGQRQPAPTQTTPDRFWFAQLDPCFVQLMAHPAAVERVRSLCGAAARLDHSYGIQMGRDWNGNENLHGGPKPDLASNQLLHAAGWPGPRMERDGRGGVGADGCRAGRGRVRECRALRSALLSKGSGSKQVAGPDVRAGFA